MDIALDEVLHFDAITSNPSTGAAADADSTPTWEVFEEDTDTAIGSGNFTKRTSKTGNYRGTHTLSSANGYEVGKWYTVVASATVSSVAGKGIVQRFRVVPAESTAGVPKTDVTHFGGNAGTFASGRPEVRVASMADNTLTASSLATDAVGEIADGVWDEATSGHTTAGTYGGRIVRATNSNVEVQITGSNHIAADVHEFQIGVIEATDFAAGAITSTVIAADAITSSQLAASAVTEIQSGLATTANQTVMIDGIGFMTSVLMGSISDAGTAGETYVISFGGSTYTVDYSGLDATGNRSTTTRTKT